ncbi:MAG: 2-oxoacid:acceptor oxidoreductase family protein [Acidobacteria bacterium]|nr:2-oxoacid:acceptor oxidoreductase family protein [Acidobacteriota bacterium]
MINEHDLAALNGTCPEHYEPFQDRAGAFYETFERKPENQEQTHYCPGCGHGITHKMVARAIDELGIQDRTILCTPVGCSVFGYYYFDVGNIQAAHGRASAVAVGAKRARPDSVVLCYQGDGDLAAIGTAEIVHAANRGEPITVFFLNNAIYGMTGGQMAPTTLIGMKSTTTPNGRDPWNEGYPLHICELFAQLDAPVYLERVALGNSKQLIGAARAIKKGIENQVKGLGFSLIEILSPCPTIWKMNPVDAQHWVRDELTKVFPPGVYRDRTKDAPVRPAPKPKPALADLPKMLVGKGGVAPVEPAGTAPAAVHDLSIRIAGFGGQGVLMLGQVLAEAGLSADMRVSWLPSYGPEMRSGTSNCHVRISHKEIASPVVTKPNVLLALNEPSLRKFLATVEPGGWVLYNGTSLPEGMERDDVHFVIKPFTELADQVGDARAGNIVMLGTLLEATGMLSGESIDAALKRLVKTERWLELDRKALAKGRETFHLEPVSA